MDSNSQRVDKAYLRQIIEKQRNLMIAVATGGPRIDSVNQEYQQRRIAIRTALAAMSIENPNPYGDLWDWYGKWSSGDLPTYRSRREYIRNLYAPLIERLEQPGPLVSGPLREPTGWTRVDRGTDKVRKRLETAVNEEDYQGVGLLCRETLISLAQAVYDPTTHSCSDGMIPSETDAKRMLQAYIDAELPGRTNEATRRYAKAALSLANDLQHRRTASFREAALCAEATASVVNSVAVLSGRQDPG